MKVKTLEDLNSLLAIAQRELKEGDVYKNHKELCRKLGQPDDKKSNSRKAQDNAFLKCFDYHKIDGTQKIMIDKVYSKLIITIDTEKAIALFQELFLNWIEVKEMYNKAFFIDSVELLNELCVISKEYYKLRSNIYKEDYQEESEQYDLIQDSNSILKQEICKELMDSLMNDHIIGSGRQCYLCLDTELNTEEEVIWKTDVLLYVAKTHFNTTDFNLCISSSSTRSKYWELVDIEWRKKQNQFTTTPQEMWKLMISSNIVNLTQLGNSDDIREIELKNQLISFLRNRYNV